MSDDLSVLLDNPDRLVKFARNSPRKLAEAAAILENIKRTRDREFYENSFENFIIRAWQEVDPAELDLNWHHQVIAEHLVAVSEGEIRNLIINIPPRPVSDESMVPCRDKGLVPLREIVVGDFVLTHKRRWRQVTAVLPQGEIECLRLTGRRGRQLDLSPDHRILTPDGWVSSWLLRADDVVGVVPGLACGAKTVTEYEARLLGYLVGDGNCSGTPNVTAKSNAVARDVTQCALAIGFIPKHQTYALKTRRVSLSAGDQTHTGIYARVALTAEQSISKTRRGYRGPVRLWLSAHGLDGANSYTKRVPISIMRGSNELVREFLGAYWSCDGYIETRGVKRDGVERDDLRMGCDSVSKGLITDIQQLLTRIGINSNTSTKVAKIKTKRQGDSYTSYRLVLTSQDDCSRFARTIRLAHEKDDRIRKARRRRFDFDRDIWGEVIFSSESIGKKSCRCLSVHEDNSFVANDFAVHNTGKTTIANILWPAWVWAQPPDQWGYLSGPHVQFLCVSYASLLSEEIAVKMRRLVTGDWYQSLWGDRVKIQPDQQSRANFGTTSGGARISASIEGGILGKGGDVQLIDDPMTPKEANSAIERDRVMRDIREGLSTRLNNQSKGARVLLMQRVHLSDPTSYALESWTPNTHLMFPMKFETRWPCPQDIRGQIAPDELVKMGRDSAEGLLLWPRRFGEKTLAALEFQLGPFASAAQLQQYPVPRSGGIIGDDDWQIWPEDVVGVDDLRTYPGGLVTLPLPEVSHVIVVLDTAQSEKETADFNGCVVWGVWHRKRKPIAYQQPIRMGESLIDPSEYTDDGEQTRAIMMGAWRMRAKLNDQGKDHLGNPRGLVQRVAQTARNFGADRIIIEDKTRGLDLRNELIRQFQDQFKVELFNPRKHGDKVQRLHAVQPLFDQKLVYAPANCHLTTNPDGSRSVGVKEFSWCRMVIDEVAQVPRGAHDDLADCVSSGLLMLREGGYLQLTREYLDQQVRSRIWRGNKQSVRDGYGV